MKGAYLVLIAQNGQDYLVYVPDFKIYTEGKNIPNAIEMTRDANGKEKLCHTLLSECGNSAFFSYEEALFL